MSSPELADLEVELFGQRLATPIIGASGTCGFGLELAEVADLAYYGAVVLKTVTPEPRQGNRPPRLYETACGLLNSIGLQNPGWEAFKHKYWPEIQAKLADKTKLIVSVGGESAEEFAALAGESGQLEGAFAVELNLSCPNVQEGGRVVGVDGKTVGEIVQAAKAATELPVIAKLSPDRDVVELAQAAEEAGADAVTVANTFVGTAIKVESRRYFFANRVAGLSGPAIKPLALRLVMEVASHVQLPVLGAGGISNWRDAAEFLLAGASGVQVGTAQFVNPQVTREIAQGLAEYAARQGFASVSELVGASES